MRKLIFILSLIFCTAAFAIQQSISIRQYIQTINHVCIIVPNMDRTLHFYRDILGFKLIKDNTESNAIISKELGLSNVKLRNVFLQAPGGFELQVIQFYHPKENLKKITMTSIGYNHIGIGVTDLQKVYQLLKAQHVKIIASPIIKKSSAYAIFFAQDPDGNRIEFFQKLAS